MDARIRIMYAMVRMYACVYVCVWVRLCVRIHVCTYSCVYVFMCVRMYVCTHVCVRILYVLIGSMYVCM